MTESSSTRGRLTRRGFLKTAGAAAGVAGLAGVASMATADGWLAPASAEAAPEEHVARTYHQSHCGGMCSLACTVRDGRMVKVQPNGVGNPDFQTICLKGISEVAHIYGKGRVQTPLKRVGERGSGQFEPISWDEALDEVAFARARGQRVYVETCPQYLALDDGVYYDANWSMAARYVCAPPIRAEENQRALWRGLRRGEIQTISTDHCSFTLAQKDMGREDFTKIPGGLPGVETRGEVVYTRGVAAGRMTVAGMCRALCENPAKLYGLYPRKGVIAAGSDADIVVYDPKASHILSARDMVTKAGYTPFEGLRTEGGIAKVYLRGSLMVEDGKIVGGPEGQYLRRGLCTL